MRSKSRFTTLVLLETWDLCAIALYASRPLSPGATQHLLASVGRYPLTRTGLPTGWIAPACLAHSFDHLVGAGEQRLRGGDARPFCAAVEPGEDTRTLSMSKCHWRVRRFIEPSHRV